MTCIIENTQIRTLTHLRDTLLPKLMSGEVAICSSFFSGDNADSADCVRNLSARSALSPEKDPPCPHRLQGRHCPPLNHLKC